MIFLALTFAVLFAVAVAVFVRHAVRASRAVEAATARTLRAEAERDRLRACRWAVLRPLTGAEMIALAKHGHGPCRGQGRVKLDRGTKQCSCTRAKFQSGVDSGRYATSPAGVLCAVEPMGTAQASR